jgi:hypothetical protein
MLLTPSVNLARLNQDELADFAATCTRIEFLSQAVAAPYAIFLRLLRVCPLDRLESLIAECGDVTLDRLVTASRDPVVAAALRECSDTTTDRIAARRARREAVRCAAA